MSKACEVGEKTMCRGSASELCLKLLHGHFARKKLYASLCLGHLNVLIVGDYELLGSTTKLVLHRLHGEAKRGQHEEVGQHKSKGEKAKVKSGLDLASDLTDFHLHGIQSLWISTLALKGARA